jgi:hypothetical protein
VAHPLDPKLAADTGDANTLLFMVRAAQLHYHAKCTYIALIDTDTDNASAQPAPTHTVAGAP